MPPEALTSSFEMIDASSWNEEFLSERIEEEALRTFDLERGPVLRMALFTREIHQALEQLVASSGADE